MNLSGDLEVDAKGDIKLADSYESKKSAINWFLRTDKGEFFPDKRLGCNVGTFIGKKMSNANLNQLELSINRNLTKFAIAPTDVRVDVVPISHEEAAIFVSVKGKYLDDDGNVLDSDTEVIKYIFPYLEGEPTPIL